MTLAIPDTTSPIQVAILAFDGCLTSAVSGLLDTLGIANLWALRRATAVPFATRVLAGSAGVVQGSSGFAIPVDALDSASQIDVAIVPPIFAPIHATLSANTAILAWLRAPHGALVASVCTGAFFLAEAGLLAGRRATTNPAFADAFCTRYPDIELAPEQRLIDEGRVLCAGSTTAFLDLALHLIDRFAGHELAVLSAKSLCVDMSQRSQLPYFLYVAPKDHGDADVLKLQFWLEEHYREPLSSPELARRGGMSQRTLNRRFRLATGMAPIDYLHRIRIERAKHQLESSSLSVDQITASVGYQDARSFSRLFRTLVGLSPREYRTRFRSPSASH